MDDICNTPVQAMCTFQIFAVSGNNFVVEVAPSIFVRQLVEHVAKVLDYIPWQVRLFTKATSIEINDDEVVSNLESELMYVIRPLPSLFVYCKQYWLEEEYTNNIHISNEVLSSYAPDEFRGILEPESCLHYEMAHFVYDEFRIFHTQVRRFNIRSIADNSGDWSNFIDGHEYIDIIFKRKVTRCMLSYEDALKKWLSGK